MRPTPPRPPAFPVFPTLGICDLCGSGFVVTSLLPPNMWPGPKPPMVCERVAGCLRWCAVRQRQLAGAGEPAWVKCMAEPAKARETRPV